MKRKPADQVIDMPVQFHLTSAARNGAAGNAGLAQGRNRTYSVISLFSGCGGMDLGFAGGFWFGGRYYDELPFNVVWANDVSEKACDTYRANLGDGIVAGDIADAIRGLPLVADAVIGGFPCQDVSINGARKIADGQRTVLYEYMVDAIRRTNPKIFVAENVKGLLMSGGEAFFERMIDDFSLDGYSVSHRVYLAADYGVPQMRERVFIIGVKDGFAFKHPKPIERRMTAREAIGDLESAGEDDEFSHIWSKASRSPEQGNRRLAADKPSTTIRAEHHGNIQWHYSLDRRISLREAARLQSFPDEFRFTSRMRETERQIGNAVPPALAWHIASSVRDCLDAGRI